MPVNLDKPHLWKADIEQSVDMYNDWFLVFAPKAYRETRIQTTEQVEKTLKSTGNLTDVSPALLKLHPSVLPSLRMSTCPPIAVDRLVGLTGVSKTLVENMEEGILPPRMKAEEIDRQLERIGNIIEKMADPDIFVWLTRQNEPTELEIYRAATIVADRLCGSIANPIIRNAQEKRQLAEIENWLLYRNYRRIKPGERVSFGAMPPGTFSFRMNVPGIREDGVAVNIPIDAVIKPKTASIGELPLLFEAKSAGDFTNVNKRKKEEATKVVQLRKKHGSHITLNLFLCGYFNPGYLGFAASDSIDWVWEHRINDLAGFNL